MKAFYARGLARFDRPLDRNFRRATTPKVEEAASEGGRISTRRDSPRLAPGRPPTSPHSPNFDQVFPTREAAARQVVALHLPGVGQHRRRGPHGPAPPTGVQVVDGLHEVLAAEHFGGDAEHPRIVDPVEERGLVRRGRPGGRLSDISFLPVTLREAELRQNHARLLVAHAGVEALLHGFHRQSGERQRVRGRVKEPHQHLRRVLRFVLTEDVGVEEDRHRARGEAVLAELPGGSFDVVRDRGRDGVRVLRRFAEAARAADLKGLRGREFQRDAHAAQELFPRFRPHDAEAAPHRTSGKLNEFERRVGPHRPQPLRRAGAHAPNFLHGGRGQGLLAAGIGQFEPVHDAPEGGVRLGEVIAQLRERLRGRDPDAGGHEEPLPKPGAKRLTEFGRFFGRQAEVGQVRKDLVDRVALNGRHHLLHHVDAAVRNGLVELVVRRPHRHAVFVEKVPHLEVGDAALQTQLLRFLRERDDVPVVVGKHDDGLSSQRGVEDLLAARVERVDVDVKDDGGRGHDGERSGGGAGMPGLPGRLKAAPERRFNGYSENRERRSVLGRRWKRRPRLTTTPSIQKFSRSFGMMTG